MTDLSAMLDNGGAMKTLASALSPGAPAADYSGMASGLIPKLSGIQGKAESSLNDIDSQRQGVMKEIDAIPKPDLPKLQDIPQPSNYKEQLADPESPLGAFKLFGPVLAALGSMKSRQPLTAALKSAGGMIKGYTEGKTELAKQHEQEWKDSMDAAMKQNEEEIKKYNAVLSNSKLTLDEKLAKLQALTASHGDVLGIAQLEQGGVLGMERILELRQNAQDKYAAAQDKTSASDTGNIDLSKPEGIAELANKTGFTVDGLKQAAERFRQSGTMPPLGRNSGNKSAAIQNLAAEMDKKEGRSADDSLVNQASYKANSAALSTLEKSRANVETFEGTAVKNADLALSLADKGEGGQSPVINRWVRAGGANVAGDPDITAFNVAINTFSTEYAKIMSSAGGNGGVTSDAARSKAEELINPNQSPEQIKKNIQVMKKEMRNRIDSINDEEARLKGQLKGGFSSDNSPKTSGNAPPVNLLQKGHNTTFKNGQTWTLGEDGQPVQVK